MIDRFGPLPPETANLVQLMEIKANAKLAGIAKLDVGTKGALVSFHGDAFANVPGLIAYVERLKGRARIRPDNKLSISGRSEARRVRNECVSTCGSRWSPCH